MKIARVIVLVLGGIMFFSFFTGCSNNKYDAEMYSASEEWILTSFLAENKVKGAYYKNPDYVEGFDDTSEEYYYDETSPENRTFIIKDQETYNTIFRQNALTVDFDEEMVYLYVFADIYPNRTYYIEKISLEEKVYIYFRLEKNNKKDASAPYQRCLIVKMVKNDISNVEFIKQK